MRKLIALLLTLAMMCCLLPATVAEGAIDTSEHVKIVYLVTGDKPTNRTDEVLAKINEKLTEKVNAELEFRWIEWTDWQTQYNLALATQSGDIDLIGTATDWLDAWPNCQKGAFLALSEDMLRLGEGSRTGKRRAFLGRPGQVLCLDQGEQAGRRTVGRQRQRFLLQPPDGRRLADLPYRQHRH